MTFRVGDAVTTTARDRVGHHRLPHYLRAKSGRVEAAHGVYPLPTRARRAAIYANRCTQLHLRPPIFGATMANRIASSMPTSGNRILPAPDNYHHHDHDHDPSNSSASALTQRVNAVISTLERAGITSGHEIDVTLERFLAGATPSNGARIVARAWNDDAFKVRLLADANAAIDELGIDLTHWATVKLRAVENTASVHNVVVCTLCSCYPIALLGPSPSWYKSEAYRARIVREPRAVLREFGCIISEDVRIDVWDSTAELRYFVIPKRPAIGPTHDEAALAKLVSRDALIGVAAASETFP